MRLSILELPYWTEYCKAIFGFETLNMDRTYSEFSFNHQAGTNTIFTNGGDDPW